MLLSAVIRLASIAAFVCLSTNFAMAYMFCSEPSEPYCVDGSGYFDDKYSFESCKSDVESYVQDIADYVECLRVEQNEKIQKSNDIMEKFNCRAEGQSYC